MNSCLKTQNTNGRINILTPNLPTHGVFSLYDKIPSQQCTTLRGPTSGMWDETTLSKMFFSKANIQIIQNGIRAGVYNASNGQYIIPQQNCDSLKIIMRSVFLQNSINNGDVTEQIRDLNKIVLKYCINQVYGEAQGYIKYLSDASEIAIPLAPPIMVSKGDKQLELKHWF